MRIGHLDTEKRVVVVAEVGNNHEGDVELAKRMVAAAAEAGADAVKFQTFRTEHYVSRGDAKRYNMLKRFELGEADFTALHRVAGDLGLAFISTPFDLQSARFLSDLVVAFKIASGDNTFYPLLQEVARFGKPVILSCGLAGLVELKYAKALIEKEWNIRGIRQDLAMLHCVTSYPVPDEEANLGVIGLMIRELDCTVGYSDHTLGVEAAVLSVAAGARIVEKHFTLDKAQSEFRDHQLSADPADMKSLVERIRRVETLLGEGRKILQPCEQGSAVPVRRSIVADRDLAEGTILSSADITWVRPGGGVAPGSESALLGRRLLRSVGAGEMILAEDVGE